MRKSPKDIQNRFQIQMWKACCVMRLALCELELPSHIFIHNSLFMPSHHATANSSTKKAFHVNDSKHCTQLIMIFF